MEWIQVTHNSDPWYDPMGMVMAFTFHKKKENLSISWMTSNISEDGGINQLVSQKITVF